MNQLIVIQTWHYAWGIPADTESPMPCLEPMFEATVQRGKSPSRFDGLVTSARGMGRARCPEPQCGCVVKVAKTPCCGLSYVVIIGRYKFLISLRQ